MRQLDQLDPSNPFARPDAWQSGWPPLDQITDDHVLEAVMAGIEARAATLTAVRDAARPPVFGDVLDIERAHNLLWTIRQVWSVLLKTAGSLERHRVNETISALLANADADAWLDAGLAAHVAELHGRRDELGLDEQDLALLDRVHRNFRRAGAYLNADARETLRGLGGQQARLQAEIERRLGSGLADAAVHVTDRAELVGLDDAELAAAAAAATDRGLTGWLITQPGTSVPEILSRLQDAGLRRRVYDAAVTRCSGGDEHDTRQQVVDLLRVRARRARLLGYGTHADLVLEQQTAGSLQAVRDLLHQLAPMAASLAETEDSALGLDGPVSPWDRPFLAASAAADDAGGEQPDPREYLALSTVLGGVTSLVADLFDVRFHERPDLAPHVPHAWVWQATDSTGRHLGLVLVDLHRRTGKRAGAWTTELSAQSTHFASRPVVALCLNLPTPIEPATGSRSRGDLLLTPKQAAQVWHEIGGHVAHAMLSDVRYPGDAGHARMPRDVIEVIPVVLERWALDPTVLPGYARHHATGAPIPASLAAQLTETRPGAGRWLVEDVSASLVDLALHNLAPEDIPTADELENFAARVLTDAGLGDLSVAPRYPITTFRHIWVGGYDARYYAYAWADVLAAQIQRRHECVEWMKEVMALGALGADRFPAPDPAAFLRRLGITD